MLEYLKDVCSIPNIDGLTTPFKIKNEMRGIKHRSASFITTNVRFVNTKFITESKNDTNLLSSK